MAKNRLHKIISRVVEIRPGEEIIVLLLFFNFFLITAPYWVIKPLRDSLILNKLGYESLPWAYLLTAVVIGFVVGFHTKLQINIPRRLLIILSLLFFIFTCLLFWVLLPREWKWLPLAFWVWANIFIIVLGTQFWLTVNDIFNPREAKRMIGFFTSGGILGGIIGAMTTGFLAKTIGSNSLLFVASGLLVACIFVVNYIFIWQRKEQSATEKAEKKEKEEKKRLQKVGLKDCFDTVRKDNYLRLMGGIVAITLIVSTFIDFQFKGVVQNRGPAGDKLTGFFGDFYTVLLVFSFLLSLLMTSNLIKRFGIRLTLLLYPLVLLLCSVGIAASPVLIFAIVIKGSDKSLSFSLNQSVRELLFIPISPEHKDRAKPFIDMFINRFAKGIAAGILLLFMLFIDDIRYVSLISAVFILAWIFLNLKVSKEYTNTIKQKLEVKWERADREVAEKMDLDYTKLIFDTIESKNRSAVLHAMHLFDLIKQDKLTPEIKKLISYKSDEVRASSLAGLFGSEDTTILLDTDDYIDEEVLGKEIEEIMSMDVYQDVMKSYIEKTLSDKSMDSETAKMELAKAIGLMDFHSPLAQKLEELLQDESPEVAKYALESAAKIKKKEHVPALIKKLSSPITREDASAALEKYGHKVVGTLADYLADTDEDIELRKGVSSVLARIGTQDAADFLSWELAEGKGDMDNELIDALDRIRSGKSDIQFQKGVIEANISEEIKSYCQIFIELFNLKTKGKKEEEEENLKRNLTNSMMNVFKLLGLIYSYEDITKAYQNIKTGTKNSVAYAIELLDNILEKEMRDIVFPVVEDLPPEERVKRCLDLLKNSSNL
ncbi:MAG: Npt1/Npt2 family nucleotide transporter [Candidatus Aminicenantaceae bacterium]